MIKEILRWHGLLSAWPLQLLYFKRKTYYEDPAVQNRILRGGALIISNHYHVFDFAVTCFLFPFRKLYVVLKSDIYSNKFLAWGMSIFGGIRSDRDKMGMKFIEDSVRLLRRGRLVQIFPEAYITPDGTLQEFKTGYLLIAQRADAPIIPVITDGNYGLLRRTHLLIGKPIRLSDLCRDADPTKEQIEEMNRIVWEKVRDLKLLLDARIAADRKETKK